LFQLAEAAARQVNSAGLARQAATGLRVGLSILEGPAMHGTVERADLRGIDAGGQVIAVSEGSRSAWAYDPGSDAASLVERAAREAQITNPQAAAVTSFRTATSESSFCFGNAPRPQSGPDARPPAVAGQFYPGDPVRLTAMVDELLAEAKGTAASWPAAMVPHAGLVYSGRIAAAVLKRLEIPETVVIIGPKHTRLGFPFAVAPHAAWNLPGWNLKSNVELARQLVDRIPELELDAAAHQREHAIEVELPFLARLAPASRVVGIAIGAGDLDRCRGIGAALADVIRDMPRPPLLLISSDMNHFATDAENRRLDAMALEAMESLDPARLHETVRRHDISMCGVLPAVIVMETLRQLGKLERCERVAYGTSADVSGDKNRVVGYAGMLLG
jgi:AmmeMemoRadiSam system protein B